MHQFMQLPKFFSHYFTANSSVHITVLEQERPCRDASWCCAI